MGDVRASAEASDDYSLMQAVASRDPDALAALYDRHSPLLLALCTRVLHDRGAAEELLIEIFEEVWNHSGRYDAARACPSAYLTTLARSRAIDRLRSRARQRAFTPVGGVGTQGEWEGRGTAANIADPASGRAGPLELALADERRQTVLSALSRLDPMQREAIEAAFYEGLSHAEVAERMSKPLGTVKSGIRRGLLRLRDLLISERSSDAEDGAEVLS